MSSGSLIAHLRSAAYGETPALRSAGVQISHAHLLLMVDAMIADLQARGVAQGDTVLILGENCAESLIAQLAVPAMGAIAVPLATPVMSGRLEQIVETAQPRICLVAGQLAVPDSLAAVRVVLRPDDAVLTLSPPPDASAGRGPEFVALHSDAPAAIRFTSGSTGLPKGVVISQGAMLHTARTLAGVFSLTPAHSELLLMSIASSDGWQRVAATLFAGGCVCITDGPLTLVGMLEDFAAFSATGLFTPPPLIRMLLLEDKGKASSAMKGCRAIEIGSAPIAETEIQALLALLPESRVFVHYGLTECSRATVLDARRNPRRLQTVGQASPDTSVEVRDKQGRALPAGEQGQIFVTGPQLAQRYWKAPALTAGRFENGWLATGDSGFMDADGFLTFVGRSDDMINCAGHCFFPEEAERELGPVRGVQNYLVVGMPDARGVLHQVPWLFAVPEDADSWAPDHLLREARQRLPPHMRPRRVVVVPHLSMKPSGKPDRRGTVALFQNAGGQQ